MTAPLPADILRAQRHALVNTIAANTAANADRIGRKMLDNLNAQMRRYVARIDGELSRGAQFAEDPATLADLIKQSADQRSLATPTETQMEKRAA